MSFQLLRDFGSVSQVTAQFHAAELFEVLSRFRQAVRGGEVEWADFEPVQEYAGVCFWAIRKLEYSFAAEVFGTIESELDRPLNILDVGCGVVPLCNWLSRRGHAVTAIDPDKDVIAFLIEHNLNEFYGSNVDFQAAHSEELRFPDATFDVVTCVSVLEHVAPGNDRLSLLEMARVLKPGGKLIITFDVAPPPPPNEGDTDWPADRRRFAKPFSALAARRLVRAVSSAYDVSEDQLPSELESLTWEQVGSFWRAAQEHDERAEPEREYLALAGSLRRNASPVRVSPDELADAYLEGQAAIEERLGWFQRRAGERLALVETLNERATAYQVQLREKEALIQDLDAAARARLEVAHELGRQLASSRADVDTRSSIDRLGQVLAEQSRVLDTLTERAESLPEPQARPSTIAQLTNGRNGTRQPKLGDAGPVDSSVLAAIERLEDQVERLAREANQAELRALRREKEAAEAVAEAREAVIQEQRRALEYLRGRGLVRRVRSFFEPRIGVLHHYDPRPMVIPRWYESTPPPSNAPTLSLVTATLNQGHFLERTLRSVLGQQYPDLEYILQDGGSTDETLAVLDRYAESLAKVDSRPDGGLGEALDNGFRLASGEVMAYLNSDDLLLPGALNYVVRYFIEHPDVDVVYGHRVLIDEHDQEIGRWVLPPHDDAILPWVDYIPQETLFWRRRIWEKAGGHIDRSLRFAVDWDLLLRFRNAGAKMHRLPRFLGAFRVHENQKTSAEMIRGIGAREIEMLRERALGRPVSQSQIHRALEPYLRQHFIYHKLYRMGLLRY